MKRLLFPLLLCALLLPMPTAHGAELQVAAWLYESGTPAPLSGAAFTLSPTDRTGVTGADGTLTFSDLHPGAYQLTQTDAPAGYLPLDEPVALLLHDDSSVTVAGRTMERISVFHRSGEKVLFVLLFLLSLAPMVLRLWWLHRHK